MRTPIRLGVIGLGMMGRHHARIASRLEDVEFVGGADPKGDPHRSLGGYPLFDDVSELLEAGIDAAILAVPAEMHEKSATELAANGVHTLIEKPLGADLETAKRIRDTFEEAVDLIAAVGYVERFNPALQELKKRLGARELGHIFAIATKRVGPYPLRVQEVGVVRDLATHDIDIIHWLGGPFESVESETVAKLGTAHEDLVEVLGRLKGGIVASMSVNWLTPAKERSVTILGERGAFVADLLSSDLTFYSNSAVPVEWDEMARLRGVSEGNVIRFAIRKPEPLQTELENFRDAVMGDEDAQYVSLAEGVRTMEVADQILAGARTPR